MQNLPINVISEDARQFEKMFSFDIWPYTTLCKFRAGEALCRQGEVESRLFFVIKGRAKILIEQPNGKTTLISFVQAPAFVGEIELLKSQNESHSVVATGNVTAFVIDTSHCRHKLLQDVTFLQRLCIFLSQKTLNTSVSHSKNDAYKLDVRLADFILKNSVKGVYNQPHTEVCQYLGVTYRHLLYVIAAFVKKGFLAKQGRTYIIADRDCLAQLAGEILD